MAWILVPQPTSFARIADINAAQIEAAIPASLRTPLPHGDSQTANFRLRRGPITAQSLHRVLRFPEFHEGYGVVLCALLDGLSIKSIWLFDATQLQTLARVTSEKLTIVASVKATSRDKFQPCRCDTLATAVDKIISVTLNS